MRKHRRAVVGDVCDLINGNGFRPSEWKCSGLPIIRIQNLNGSQLFNYFAGRPRHRWLVEPGALLFAWAGVKGVSFGPTIWSGPKGVLNQHIYRVEPKKDIDLYWLYCVLQRVTSVIEQKAHGFKSSLLHVHKEDISEQVIDVPPLGEQRLIAQILRTWDESIEYTRALIDAKEQEFVAFAASLLTGHRRFRSSAAPWTRHFVGDVTREVGARNGNRYGREWVKAVNKAEGMIPMKDHVIAGDLSRYRIVPPHGFAYNPMRLNIGSIAMNEHGAEVLVSPDYVVFEALPGQLDPHFLNHFRRTSRWRRFMEIAGSGSVRIRIYYDDLAEMPIHLPPIDEQRRIADFLDLARREIDLRRVELAALEKQKRGLMQKLLTGEWRVPLKEGDVVQAAQAAGEAVAAGAG